MPLDLRDTIVALCTAPGPGARAVVRLSGQKAVKILEDMFETPKSISAQQRFRYEGFLHLEDLTATVPAEVYVWPPPRSFTGQLLVEIHMVSCPPLVELLIGQILERGVRSAQRGEFTMRAFLAGKLDLTRAEAIMAVVDAGSRDELSHALRQLAGGIALPLQDLRSDLLDLLADLEAGLDFAEEDIQFVQKEDLLMRITRGMALVTGLRQQIDRRSHSERPFRAALIGPPNAGKSSLFNALGKNSALVSSMAGTTRDYLLQRLSLEELLVELIDTAGWQSGTTMVEEQAQMLGREIIQDADLLLCCQDASQSAEEVHPQHLKESTVDVLMIATKCDLASAPGSHLATSAATGLGLAQLKNVLKDRARKHARPALAPSLSRCRHHVVACLDHLRNAYYQVVKNQPPEILALEVRSALDQLGEMVGGVYTDDLLDRIFSRFCIGK